jgi:hypothetical protein
MGRTPAGTQLFSFVWHTLPNEIRDWSCANDQAQNDALCLHGETCKGIQDEHHEHGNGSG